MRFRTRAFAAIGAALTLSGCLTIDHATSAVTGEEHVVVSDYGWKLFNVFPIFRSEISQPKVQQTLLDYAAARGKRAEDLVYFNYETVMFDVPTLSITIPVPYLVCYQKIQLSGVLR